MYTDKISAQPHIYICYVNIFNSMNSYSLKEHEIAACITNKKGCTKMFPKYLIDRLC